MSDGINDVMELRRRKAVEEAKKRFSKLEIVDRDWRKVYTWNDMQLNYLRNCVCSSGKKEECKQCGGKGKEHIVYVHEVGAVYKIDEEFWDCRKCYGVGLI